MTDQESRPGVPRLEGADLIHDVLAEATEPQHERQEQHQPAPTPSAQPGGYYDSLIAQKRKEFRELSDKVANQATNGKYLKKDSSGNEFFDFPQLVADQARMTTLKQEIDDYRDEASKRAQTAAQRFETAKGRAMAYARTQMARLPEGQREKVAEKFVELFNGVSENKIWERARYANVANIDADIQQLWESAVGRVYVSGLGGEGANPAPTGLDGSPAPEKSPEPEEDPFTNNLMYAYERRKGRSMTFAEAKKARMEAEAAAREGGKR